MINKYVAMGLGALIALAPHGHSPGGPGRHGHEHGFAGHGAYGLA